MERGINLSDLLEDLLRQELTEDKNEEWLEYNSKLAKLFSKLKKDTGAETIRQNYRGTGSQKYRRQMWVRWPNGGSMDIWLDDGEVMFGGIVSILPGGQRVDAPKKRIPYEDHSPEETYKAVVANLAKWLKDAKAPEPPPDQVAPVAAAARAPEVTKTSASASGSSGAIRREAAGLSKGDFVELAYRQYGGSPNKSATYEVVGDPITSSDAIILGLKNVRSKAGRGSVLTIEKKSGEVLFQVSPTATPANVVSLSKTSEPASSSKARARDINPDKLKLSEFTEKWLSSGRGYTIRKTGDAYSLAGPRGATYHGIRNRHSGIVGFIEKPVEKLTITDRDGTVRLRAP